MPSPMESRPRSPSPALFLALLAILVGAAAPAAGAAETACTLTQITASDDFDSFAGGLSADGRLLALTSRADLTGANPDHSRELFVYDRGAGALEQLTDLADGYVHQPTFDGDASHVFYRTNVDPDTGGVLPAGEVLVRLDRATGETTVLARDFHDVVVSADGTRAALTSQLDLTGGNGDGNTEVFLLDLATGTYVQVSDTLPVPCPPFPGLCARMGEPSLSADGGRLAFFSDLDPETGEETEYGGVYVHDVATGTTTEVTVHADPYLVISGDGASVAFPSLEALTAGDTDGVTDLFVHGAGAPAFREVPGPNRLNNEPIALDRTGSRLAFNAVPKAGNGRDAYLFAVDTGVVAPLLAEPGVDDFAAAMTPDGAWVSLHSKANLRGGNLDGSFEVHLASCAAETVPPPPPGEWLTSGEFPDFRFKVRITAGGEVQGSRLETACLPETVCISGALPGRSELFIRIVGPKPNGKLWPNLVRFSTSTVEAWIEQLSTETVKHYRLEGVSPGSSELDGLFDRDGFTP